MTQPDVHARMSLHEAIAALLDEYQLETYVDAIRDDVKGDPSHPGLSVTHPKVVKFRQVCATLRAAIQR